MTSHEVVLGRGGPIEVGLLPALGARLHRLRVLGHELLRTPSVLGAHEREPFFWGAYVMAPWCNRLTTERVDFRGTTIELPSNFDDGSAIHGQVYAVPWEQVSESGFAVNAGGQAWPWRYRVESAIELNNLVLTLTLRLTNTSETTMPGGIGLHPWLAGSPLVAISATHAYTSNLDPSAQAVPVETDTDMRDMRQLTPGIDATWTGLSRPPVQLSWPHIGLGATLQTTASHIVAANAPERGAIAVEPQTHAPQGLRRLIRGESGAMSEMEPGAELELRMELAFSARRVPAP